MTRLENVSIKKELLFSIALARTKYKMYLDEKRREREVAKVSLKRKALEDELEAKRKKSCADRSVCRSFKR